MARLTEELLAAYRTTRYCAWPNGDLLELRIGQRNPALAALLEQHGQTSGCFITAWNPLSKPNDKDQNARANALLERDLRRSGWPLFPGEGRGEDPTWEPEASFLVLGPDRYDTAGFASHYRQHAAVYFETSISPQLGAVVAVPVPAAARCRRQGPALRPWRPRSSVWSCSLPCAGAYDTRCASPEMGSERSFATWIRGKPEGQGAKFGLIPFPPPCALFAAADRGRGTGVGGASGLHRDEIGTAGQHGTRALPRRQPPQASTFNDCPGRMS